MTLSGRFYKIMQLCRINLYVKFKVTVDLGSTQPLTEMSTRNFPGGKGRPVHKTDNITAICESIV
jgi:hypothetical protein